jgi:HSP20 family protein
MLLNRVSPFGLLDEMQRSFSLIDEMSQESRPMVSRNVFPALNSWSDENNFYVEAELPGLSLEALEIFVTDGQVLTIQGERAECGCGEQGKWVRRERGYGSFVRQIELPGPVQAEQVEASLKNGVLTITLPKASEIRPRRIEVKKG